MPCQGFNRFRALRTPVKDWSTPCRSVVVLHPVHNMSYDNVEVPRALYCPENSFDIVVQVLFAEMVKDAYVSPLEHGPKRLGAVGVGLTASRLLSFDLGMFLRLLSIQVSSTLTGPAKGASLMRKASRVRRIMNQAIA